MKKIIAVFMLALCASVFTFAQENDTTKQKSTRPWEEIIYRTMSGTIPGTNRTYTVEVRFSEYGNEAYITYIVYDSLYYESDAVYAVRDVARKLTAEFGYDWYNYNSQAILRYDNEKHLARYRANVVFRKYIIQEER